MSRITSLNALMRLAVVANAVIVSGQRVQEEGCGSEGKHEAPDSCVSFGGAPWLTAAERREKTADSAVTRGARAS